MANLCNVSFIMTGPEDKCKKMMSALSGEGKVKIGDCLEINYSEGKLVENGQYMIHGQGDCRWSIYNALYSEAIDIRESLIHRDEILNADLIYADKLMAICGYRFLTIPEACKEFGVAFEAYSMEHTLNFMEHVLIRENGTPEIEERIKYETYFNLNQCTDRRECEEELGIELTDDEWQAYLDYGYFERGGYRRWDYVLMEELEGLSKSSSRPKADETFMDGKTDEMMKPESYPEIHYRALDHYNAQDRRWFYLLTDDELVELQSLCYNPWGQSYDDEVFDAIYSRANGEELFELAKAIAFKKH